MRANRVVSFLWVCVFAPIMNFTYSSRLTPCVLENVRITAPHVAVMISCLALKSERTLSYVSAEEYPRGLCIPPRRFSFELPYCFIFSWYSLTEFSLLPRPVRCCCRPTCAGKSSYFGECKPDAAERSLMSVYRKFGLHRLFMNELIPLYGCKDKRFDRGYLFRDGKHYPRPMR